MSNRFRIDPTRTTLLRRSFESQMRRRFKDLQKRIIQLVVADDSFGLTTNAVFSFQSSPDQLAGFDKWLLDQYVDGVLEYTNGEEAWTDAYIRKAYDSGVAKADAAIKKSKAAITTGPLQTSFTTETSYQKLKLLQTRSFSDLVNVTDAMAGSMRRVLVDGMLAGKGPRQIAVDLNKEVAGIGIKRATTIARTEIIRAHAEGALDHMEKMGVEEIGVEVEWSTTGDAKVCPLCASLEGAIIPIARAHGMFPRHPNCRCSPIPYVDDEPSKQARRKRLKAAIAKSLSLEKKSRWAGAKP